MEAAIVDTLGGLEECLYREVSSFQGGNNIAYLGHSNVSLQMYPHFRGSAVLRNSLFV